MSEKVAKELTHFVPAYVARVKQVVQTHWIGEPSFVDLGSVAAFALTKLIKDAGTVPSVDSVPGTVPLTDCSCKPLPSAKSTSGLRLRLISY